MTNTVALLWNVSKTFAVTMVITPVIQKAVGKTFAVVATITPVLSRVAKYFRLEAVTATLTPALTRIPFIPRTFAVTPTLTPSMSRVVVFNRLLNVGGSSASDDFNRANGALGSNWTTWNLNFGAHQPFISSNKVFGYADAPDNGGYWNANAAPADQFSQAVVAGAISINTWLGVVVRSDATGANLYNMIYFNNGGGYELRLYRKSGGSTYTQIGSTFSLPGALTAGDVIRIEVQGTTVTGLVNGVSKLSTTDSNISSGQPGIAFFAGSDALDNWQGGALGAGSVFTAAMTAVKTKGALLAASVTLTPTMTKVKIAPRTLAVTLVAVPAMTRQLLISRLQAVTVTLTSVMTRLAVRYRAFPVVSTVTPAMTRVVLYLRAFAVTGTLTAALTTVSKRFISLPVVSTLVPAMNLKQFRTFAVTVTFTIFMQAQRVGVSVSRQFDAFTTLTPVMTLRRTTVKAFAAVMGSTAALTRIAKYFRTQAATVTLIPTQTRQGFSVRTFAVISTLTPAMTKQLKFLRTVAVTVTFTPVLSRLVKYLRTLAVTGTFTAGLNRAALHKVNLAALTTVIPSMQKAVGVRLSATTTFVLALTRQFAYGVRLNASAVFTAAMSYQRTVRRQINFDAVVNMIVGLGQIVRSPSMPPGIILSGMRAVLRLVGLGRSEIESVGNPPEPSGPEIQDVGLPKPRIRRVD